MTCRRRSGPRHTTQEHLSEVLVEYPHHPLAGKRIAVVRSVVHAGLVHLVIEGQDGCRTLLPAWMTSAQAAALPMVETPQLSLPVLRELRDLIRTHCLAK